MRQFSDRHFFLFDESPSTLWASAELICEVHSHLIQILYINFFFVMFSMYKCVFIIAAGFSNHAKRSETLFCTFGAWTKLSCFTAQVCKLSVTCFLRDCYTHILSFVWCCAFHCERWSKTKLYTARKKYVLQCLEWLAGIKYSAALTCIEAPFADWKPLGIRTGMLLALPWVMLLSLICQCVYCLFV